MPDVDLYTVLDVPRSATSDEIKSAYRARVMAYHPDRVAGAGLGARLRAVAEEAMKEINEAYDVLKDPQKRAAYDARAAEPVVKPAAREREMHRRAAEKAAERLTAEQDVLAAQYKRWLGSW